MYREILIDATKCPCHTCPHGKCYAKCDKYDRWLQTETVVRCRNCKFYDITTGRCKMTNAPVFGHEFCSRGVRK